MFASGALRRVAPITAVLSSLTLAATASAETLRAAPSAALVDSVGVNIHPIFLDTAYKDGDHVVSVLKGLGVRHVRHGIHANPASTYTWINQYNRTFATKLAAAGIHSDLIVGNPDDSSGTVAQQLAEVRNNLANVAESIEGPNEWDQTGRTNWVAEVRAYQQAIYAGVKADPALRSLPVIAPSLGQWKRVTILGDLSASADYGNLHAYPGGLEPSDTFLDDQLTAERTVTGSKPVMITETGYHNAMTYGGGHRPTSERAAGIYTPRLLLEHFRRGIPRTWLYELIDQKPNADNTLVEQHFGLLRNDWSEKPAAKALRNLLAIAGTAPGGAAANVDVTLGGGLTGVRRVAVRQPDGSIVVFLWQTAPVWDKWAQTDLFPAAVSGSVAVAQPFTRADRYSVATSATPVASAAFSGSMNVTVPADDVVALRFSAPAATPTATPTATPVATPTATPVATPTATPVATPTATPVATPAATPIATPIATPTATPITTPIATPTATPTPAPKPHGHPKPRTTPALALVADTPTAAPTTSPRSTRVTRRCRLAVRRAYRARVHHRRSARAARRAANRACGARVARRLLARAARAAR